MDPSLRKSGFSLLEAMFAVALLTMGTLALAGVLIGGLRLSAVNREGAQAAQLAQQAFERIRGDMTGLPRTSQTFTGQPAVNGFPPLPYPAVDVGGQHYTLEFQCDPVNGRQSLYSVQVKVRWNEHSANFQTYFFHP